MNQSLSPLHHTHREPHTQLIPLLPFLLFMSVCVLSICCVLRLHTYLSVSALGYLNCTIFLSFYSGDLRGVAGGDGKLGCLYGKAGTSHFCDGSAHSSGCVVNGYGCLLIIIMQKTCILV